MPRGKQGTSLLVDEFSEWLKDPSMYQSKCQLPSCSVVLVRPGGPSPSASSSWGGRDEVGPGSPLALQEKLREEERHRKKRWEKYWKDREESAASGKVVPQCKSSEVAVICK